ncbi:hypothetical protein [Shewanella psychromarinicola]|nr:hypothetical protein [Shewanella psychromarinicola]
MSILIILFMSALASWYGEESRYTHN